MEWRMNAFRKFKSVLNVVRNEVTSYQCRTMLLSWEVGNRHVKTHSAILIFEIVKRLRHYPIKVTMWVRIPLTEQWVSCLFYGVVAERLKALVLKTRGGWNRPWVQILPAPPFWGRNCNILISKEYYSFSKFVVVNVPAARRRAGLSQDSASAALSEESHQQSFIIK